MRRRSKKAMWKHRRKKDFYRVMEIVSAGVMVYGICQIAAMEEMTKVIPKTEITVMIMGTLMGVLLVVCGYISRRLFRGLRIMENREWKEDEHRVYRRVG